MLTLSMDRSGQYIIVTGGYIYGQRLRSIPGMRFDPDRKIWWSIRNTIFDFDREFHGEVYYKTPLWLIEGKPAPDYSRLYYVDPSILLPPMKLPLYNYQVFGARFMIDRILKHGFVINADGVGIGKTAQAIAVMQWFAVNRSIRHFLIIGKKSIKYQWSEEIVKFSTVFDGYKVFYTPEIKKKRQKIYEEASKEEKSILITNYHNFLNDTEMLQDFAPGFCVVDEAHSVKAREGVINGNISKVIKNVPTAFLTGTPVMSRPEDIFGIVQMSDPGYFGTWQAFQDRYLVMSNKYGFWFVAGVKHLDELHNKVQDIVIRRTEYEVSVQMPEVVVRNILVDASSLQKRLQEFIALQEQGLKDQYTSVDEEIKKNGNKEELMAAREKVSNAMKSLISAKQNIATDPFIFRESSSKFAESFSSELPVNETLSPKTEAVIDLVSDIVESGDKVIMFSKFVTTCHYFSRVLEKKKINTLLYTGEEDDEKRKNNIAVFRTSEEYNVLIGSDAMAEGLNLAEARHVINIDIPDTYAIYMQRFGRIRRVTSEYDNVIVHNFLTKNSCDVDKYRKIMENKDLDGALVAASREQRQALMKAQN